MKMAQGSGMLITYALGSCIGICLYDQKIKLAALIHIMLPLNMEPGRKNTMKYADTGIRETPVTIVGTRTEGKNCGMDVMKRTIGGYEYTFAPITFLIYNAKGDNDYSDGIEADADMERFAEEAPNNSVRQMAYLYPMPMTQWGDFAGDIALLETVMRIDGRTLFDLPADSGDEQGLLRAQPVTRGAEAVRRASLEPLRRPSGATLTERERLKLEAAE